MVLILSQLLFAKQNEFEALVLQKHLLISKLHQPYLKHVPLHHQNRRDQEYQ